MSSDTPAPHLLDAVKASASRLRERQSALDARAKELDALKAKLDAERGELEAEGARITADRQAFEREGEGLRNAGRAMEQDLATINDARDKLTNDQERLQSAWKALEERERTIKADEERTERLEQAFAGRMKESESKLHNLLERAEGLVKVQANWLKAFEEREKELRTISEELHTRQTEFGLQHDSLAALKDEFKDELDRMLAEHEALATKEKSVREAEKYLASALQIAEGDHDEEQAPLGSLPALAPVEPVAPSVVPESIETPTAEPVHEDIPEEIEVKPQATKAEAMERLARAVEAWKSARDAGWKVGDIRKAVRVARDAVDAGDYEEGIRLAMEILDQLQVTASAR
jgi:chromosome segregation ATPase